MLHTVIGRHLVLNVGVAGWHDSDVWLSSFRGTCSALAAAAERCGVAMLAKACVFTL
jgi:hypothetical protein